MQRGSGRRDVWSRLSQVAGSAGSTLQRRGSAAFAHLPGWLQQACRLINRTGRSTLHDRVPGLAAEAAFFSVISLPALLLAIIGSLGLVAAGLGPAGAESLRELVLSIPQSFFSDRTYASYESAVDTVLTQTRGRVISISILLSVWTGSRAVNRYLETITIAYGVTPRPGWRRRLLALGLTIGGLLGAVAVLPPMVLGPRMLESLVPGAVADTTMRTVDLLFWPSVILFVLVGVATLYHVGVPWKTPWRRDIPGALLALTLWLLASAGLRTYLALSTRDDAIFSQLAVPIAALLWIYITAFAVLLGAEFNAQIENMWPHDAYSWRLRRLIGRRASRRSAAMPVRDRQLGRESPK